LPKMLCGRTEGELPKLGVTKIVAQDNSRTDLTVLEGELKHLKAQR